MTLFVFIPFLAIIVLANFGNRYPVARTLTVLALILVNGLFGLFGLAALVIAIVNRLGAARGTAEPPGFFPELNLLAVSIVLLLTGLVAFLPLIPLVRRVLARVMPIDPESMVHATALVFAIYLTGSSLLNLWLIPMLKDLPPDTFNVSVADLWLQALAFVLAALLGVGLFIRRNMRDVLDRLSLGPVSRTQISQFALATAGLLAFSWLISVVWNRLDPAGYKEVGRISEILFGRFATPLGAFTLGLSAGIGEELLFRGALQPRFGLLATSFLFMIAHTQYTVSPALLEIFIVGLVLGIIRNRANTTMAILIHAAYNILTVVLAPLFP